MTAILWVAVKILEHRSAEPEISIIIEEERPILMRDVTPRDSTRQLKVIAQR